MKNILTHTVLGLTLSLGASAALAQTQNTAAPTTAPAATRTALPAFTHPNEVSTDLARIDAALNSTKSFSGRFAQYGSDGSFMAGQIFLKRPGKIRFEYDAPAPLLMVSDGVTLTQIDRQLETKDRVPLKSTPLAFFLAETVHLEDDVEVISLQKTANSVRVTARDGSGEVEGAITMVFDPQTLALSEWIIHDGFGQQTRIILSELAYNQKINPRKFILRDERRGRRR